MINLSAALKAHFGQSAQTVATCWLTVRTDGTVRGFTDLDRDIAFNLEAQWSITQLTPVPLSIVGTGMQTYKAATGYTRSDIVSGADLSVDNLETVGVLNSPSINEADLHAGLWDFAFYVIFLLDWSDVFKWYAISAITRVGSVAAVATAAPLPSWFNANGYVVTVRGADQPEYNISKPATSVSTPNFNYTVSGTPATPATGANIQYQVTKGALVLRAGNLGNVTVERNSFKAELRGMTQKYSRTVGELTQPGCRAQLGDSRCKVPLTAPTWQATTTYKAVVPGDAPVGSIVKPSVYNARFFLCTTAGTSGGSEPSWNTTVGATTNDGGVVWTTINARTVIGTITGVNPDLVTLYDTARTEPGPTGGIAITGISNTNPGHVTVTDGTSFFNQEAVTLSGIVGMPLLNQVTVIRNLSGNVFDLGIDTTNTGIYGTYVSGGTVTPLGGNSGFFDFGKITFTSGLNNGFSEEVRSYVPGQWQIELPMPYAVNVGDTYTMVVGCDRALATCKTKFNNVSNMRAEPYLPGIDQLIQVNK